MTEIASAELMSSASFAVTTPPKRAGADEQTLQKFEALLLQQAFQTMLPKDESGKGSRLAGDAWRGMLAEHLAMAVARGGGVGIADGLAQRMSIGPDAPAGRPTDETPL